MTVIIYIYIYILTILISLTSISGLLLSSSRVSADEDTVVDEINITVPVSCNLTGTGMQSHNATINNGTYVSDIGTTTIKAYCNDKDGFAIYAIGYTDDTDGKNVMTSSSLGSTHDIATGTGTSGNSQWAMKLSTQTNPEPTYPITIQNSYNNYHIVPNDYDLVAKRTASTDIGAAAIGSTLTSTYQIYISNTQSAGTYVGQVKYVLVHPNYVNSGALNDAITVVFDGGDLSFPDGSNTNTVKYANVCKLEGTAYVANTPYTTANTSNLNSDGTQNPNSPYASDERVLQTITVPNADKLKVVVDYEITKNTANAIVLNGTWDGDWGNWESEWYNIQWINSDNNTSGTRTYVVDGNTATLFAESWYAPSSGYDYGFFFKVYPAYDTEQSGTTFEELPSSDCSVIPIFGTYQETTEWFGKWTATINGEEKEFEDTETDWHIERPISAEEYLKHYISDDYGLIKGTTITLHSYDPVTFDEVYAAANKTKTDDYYKIHELNSSMCEEVTVGEITDVIDVRDNNVYSIGKLSDGNCWLRDNLRLNPTNSVTANNMSASNTNATNDAIYNYLHGGNPNNNAYWTSTAVSNPNDWPNSDYVNPYINVSNNDTYGIYYNYCAVSVGTICTNNKISEGTPSYDVCPSNWKLPSTNEATASSLIPSVRDLALVRAGYYDGGSSQNESDSVRYGGGKEFYWGSKIINTSNSMPVFTQNYNQQYIEHVSGGYVVSGMRYYGNTVRCILSTGD